MVLVSADMVGRGGSWMGVGSGGGGDSGRRKGWEGSCGGGGGGRRREKREVSLDSLSGVARFRKFEDANREAFVLSVNRTVARQETGRHARRTKCCTF